MKEWFEKEYEYIVYYGIYFETIYGRFMSFLFVSKNENEWENDRIDLEEGYPMAYTVNIEDKTAEPGTIKVEMAWGGLVIVE